MSSNYTSYADVITRWDNLTEFANDIGVGKKHAYGMMTRRSIPPFYWPSLVKGASRRGYSHITYELLAKLASAGPYPRTRVRRTVSKRDSRRVR